MNWLGCILGALILTMTPDTSRVTRLLPPHTPPAQLPPGETLPVLPDLQQTFEKKPDSKDAAKSGEQRPKADRLQPMSRLEIIRFVHGEFARAKRPLPSGKEGFRFQPGKPLDENELRRVLNKGGSAANPGDNVQITQIEFRSHEIFIDINGGGRRKTRLRDRIQISVGGTMPTSTVTSSPQGYQTVGSTLILDFGKPLPDITADELKGYLSPLLDFSKQRSASVNWVETLPPEIQQAIKDRKAVVGMDRDMVTAAMGRPDKKVRERTEDGLETEDWIYGEPPAKTIFVTFAGEKVIRVKEYPH
jgi:hypothetical protein